MEHLFHLAQKLKFKTNHSLKEKMKEMLSTHYVNEKLALKKGIHDLSFSFKLPSQRELSAYECYLYKYINRENHKLNVCSLKDIAAPELINNYDCLSFKKDETTNTIFAIKNSTYLPIVFNTLERLTFSSYINLINMLKNNQYAYDDYLTANSHLTFYQKVEYLCYSSLLQSEEHVDFARNAMGHFKYKHTAHIQKHYSPREVQFNEKLLNVTSSGLDVTLSNILN